MFSIYVKDIKAKIRRIAIYFMVRYSDDTVVKKTKSCVCGKSVTMRMLTGKRLSSS